MILRPGLFLQNRYEILERIGAGGMSVVYRAKCHKLNRFVAIKVLKEEFCADQEFVARFNMEAQSAAGLMHPNIVNVYDVVNEEDLHYIVMELVNGITLKSYIATKKRLEVKESIAICIQVCQGINAAHERNIIHRDIKPQNMILSKEGKVKVADFGIARAVTKQTVGSTAVGSVHYISPEQAKGEISDERSDVYSLGVMLYEMLTGRVPFDGDSAVNIAIAHLEKRPLPPSELNAEIPYYLEEIILRCMKKKKERRFQSMKALEAALIQAREMLKNEREEGIGDAYASGGTRRFSASEFERIKEHEQDEDEDSDLEEFYRSDEEDYTELLDEEEEDYHEPVRQRRKAEVPVESPKNIRKKQVAPPSFYLNQDEEEREEPKTKKIETIMAGVGIAFAGIVIGVVIYVFMSFGGFFSSKPKNQSTEEESTIAENQVEMPDVVGLSSDLAEKRLKESNLQIKIDGEEFSDEIEEGAIISQNPKAGEVVSKYSKVEVILSKGSDKVDIAALGIDQMLAEDARAALESAGFSVEMKESDSETVEKDYLIRYEPKEPEKGSQVTLYKSTGKKVILVKVPVIIANDEAKAKTLIEGAGLVVGTVAHQFDAAVAKGMIISQEVEAGKEVEKGSALGYTVSDGPPEESSAAETQETQASVDNTTLSNNPPTMPQTQETTIHYRYTGAINTTYELTGLIGPGASVTSIKIMIRLRQNVNGQTKYTTLMEARTVKGNTILPVRFNLIEGAYGVDQGHVEIVKIEADNSEEVLQSYQVDFFKGQ